MTSKFQRPAGAYAGVSGLANRTKYQDDATATPKRAISSAKVDGDINYLIDAVNTMDEASGSRASINERLDVSLNADGTLKMTVAGAMDEWIVHANAGAMARVDNSTFTMAGDWRAIYQVNRRVRVTVNGVGLVGDISAVSYAGGLTSISCVDLVDGSGFLTVIAATPTQVAYGPLTAGVRGNTQRRTDALRIPSGSNAYEIAGASGNLVFRRNMIPVAAVTDGGIAGLAPESVLPDSLSLDVLDMLVPTGAVMPFAGSTAPSGWLLCAGQAVSRTVYFGLFNVLGTTYGAGDGTTTFNLPDLRGRVAFGLDNMGGTDSGRLSVANTLGGNGGAQVKSGSTASYTLTIADIPGHQHVQTTQGNIDAVAVGGTGTVLVGGTASITNTTNGQLLTRAAGGGGGHSHGISNFDVMPPYLLLNQIIKI